MTLKSRQASILRTLSHNIDGIPITNIAEAHGVSRRTVYYDISGIDAWLSSRSLGHVAVIDQRLRAIDIDWKGVGKLTRTSERYYLSVRERHAMLLLYVALSGRQVTISRLMEVFSVSRNTIISDIRRLKQNLASFGIVLVSIANTGYTLRGDEITVRKVIWSELQHLGNAECITQVRSFLQTTLTKVTGNDIDYYELCRSLIKQYESDLQTRCFLDSNGLEGMMIQVSWLRGLKGHWVIMGREEQITLMGTISYRSVQMSAEKLKKSGIILPSEELLYITSLMLGIKTTDFAAQSDEDEYVSELAERLIVNFERVGCLTFVNKGFVRDQLSHHIRPLYYRQKYGLSAHNPLAADVQKMYPMAFEFTRRAALESGMGILSDGELAFLTIYLSSDLDNKMLEEGDTSATRVLIVGASNMSTATLVKDQLTDVCGIQFEYEHAEPGKLHRWELDSYALVIALSPLPASMKSDNMVEAAPILTDANKQRIFEILRGNRIISRYNTLIDGIIEIVGRSIPDGDRSGLESDKLRFELFRFFDTSDRGFLDDGGAQPTDARIIHERICLPASSSWEDAILAGSRALQAKAPQSRLVERMTNLINSGKLQWYRMADDVMIVRCPMQGDEGSRVAAQIVLSADGIPSPDGRPAKVVVCMATINRYSHWGTLYNIYHYLSDDRHVRKLEEEYVDPADPPVDGAEGREQHVEEA